MRLVRWSGRYLEDKSVSEGRLNAEHLLAHVLGVPRLELYLSHDRPVGPNELAAFKGLLRRRVRREPLQYILGTVHFRELVLRCDSRALIPRPETEELVGVVLEAVDRLRGRAGTGPLRALDVGTGSGAIALALLQEREALEVVATDPDPAALELARENAERTGLHGRVDVREGAGLGPVGAGETFDVMVSNPPYVADGEWDGLEPEVREWEPRGALRAGPQGLDVLEELIQGAPRVLRPGGLLALEVGGDQASSVEERLNRGDFEKAEVVLDARGRRRMVTAERAAGRGVPGSPHYEMNR